MIRRGVNYSKRKQTRKQHKNRAKVDRKIKEPPIKRTSVPFGTTVDRKIKEPESCSFPNGNERYSNIN